jgi:hypothetical protein
MDTIHFVIKDTFCHCGFLVMAYKYDKNFMFLLLIIMSSLLLSVQINLEIQFLPCTNRVKCTQACALSGYVICILASGLTEDCFLLWRWMSHFLIHYKKLHACSLLEDNVYLLHNIWTGTYVDDSYVTIKFVVKLYWFLIYLLSSSSPNTTTKTKKVWFLWFMSKNVDLWPMLGANSWRKKNEVNMARSWTFLVH